MRQEGESRKLISTSRVEEPKNLGDIWDSQANPLLNPTVVLGDGREISGSAVSREWATGWWKLETNNGTIRFQDYQMIKVDGRPREERGVLAHWRAHLPIAGLLAFAVMSLGAFWIPVAQGRLHSQSELPRMPR